MEFSAGEPQGMRQWVQQGDQCEHKGRCMQWRVCHCLVRGERKKKYLSQFFSWVVPAAIAMAGGWLMCPHKACEGRCDRVTGVPMKGGGATTPWLASFLRAVEASMGREKMIRIQRGWLSGALSHTTD